MSKFARQENGCIVAEMPPPSSATPTWFDAQVPSLQMAFSFSDTSSQASHQNSIEDFHLRRRSQRGGSSALSHSLELEAFGEALDAEFALAAGLPHASPPPAYPSGKGMITESGSCNSQWTSHGLSTKTSLCCETLSTHDRITGRYGTLHEHRDEHGLLETVAVVLIQRNFRRYLLRRSVRCRNSAHNIVLGQTTEVLPFPSFAPSDFFSRRRVQ